MPYLQTQVTTQIVIKDNNDRILLLKRNKPSGWFTLPGGTLHQGETVDEALTREILEETGLKITVGKPFWVWQSDHIGKDLLGIVFSAKEKVEADTQIKLSKEHNQYKWFSVEELMTNELVDPYIKKPEIKE